MVRWCFPPKLYVFFSFFSLSISFSIPLSTSLFCSMQTIIYILKGHMRPLLCSVIFNDFQIFWSNYNLVLTLTYILMDNFLPLFLYTYCTFALNLYYKPFYCYTVKNVYFRFSMKLRKHINNKRLEKIQQMGVDRVVGNQLDI